MVAVDVYDHTGKPNPATRDRLLHAAFHRGIVLLGCGQAAIRFCPPLVITSTQIKFVLNTLSSCLEDCLDVPIESSTEMF